MCLYRCVSIDVFSLHVCLVLAAQLPALRFPVWICALTAVLRDSVHSWLSRRVARAITQDLRIWWCETLQRTATHCNTHCNILQHTATAQWTHIDVQRNASHSPPDKHCNTLQHTATHCKTLQHIATHCKTHLFTDTASGALNHAQSSQLLVEWPHRVRVVFRYFLPK